MSATKKSFNDSANRSNTNCVDKRMEAQPPHVDGDVRATEGGKADAERIRLASQAAEMIAEAGNAPTVVQAWFQGMNPQLEDRSPARVLRENDPHAVGPEVLAAARAFARIG